MKGIFSALVTPVDSAGGLDKKALKNLVRFELDHGVEGLYCCGSSGEGLLLDTDEREQLVEIVSSEVSGEVPFIVHTGALSTRTVVELSIHAQTHGAKAVSLIPPIYYSYTPQEVEGHYRTVLDALDIGVIVYNIPQFTGINFSKKMNSSLLNDSRIVGIKHTSTNLYELERIHEAFPDKVIYNGFDEMYLYSITAGAQATIGTTVNICPGIFKDIRKRYYEGDLAGARSVQSTLNSFVEALVDISIFPATKYAMDLLGAPCGPCRKPFISLNEKQKTGVAEALKIVEEWL